MHIQWKSVFKFTNHCYVIDSISDSSVELIEEDNVRIKVHWDVGDGWAWLNCGSMMPMVHLLNSALRNIISIQVQCAYMKVEGYDFKAVVCLILKHL